MGWAARLALTVVLATSFAGSGWHRCSCGSARPEGAQAAGHRCCTGADVMLRSAGRACGCLAGHTDTLLTEPAPSPIADGVEAGAVADGAVVRPQLLSDRRVAQAAAVPSAPPSPALRI